MADVEVLQRRKYKGKKKNYRLVSRSVSLTHVNYNSLAEVMVVRDGMEVVVASVLGVLVDTLLLMAGDLWQRPGMKK